MFAQLFRGIIGQFTDRFTNWTDEMNQNLRRINMREGGLTCIEQIATIADLPLTPANGDTYVITGTKTVKTWYDDPGTWETTSLYIPDIFWDQDTAKFWYFDGVNIVELLTGAFPGPNIIFSDSCGVFNTTSTTPDPVTNLLENITTVGNPVEVTLVGDGTGQAFIGVRNITPVDTEARGFIDLKRDGVVVATYPLYLIGGGSIGNSLWLRVPAGIVFSEELPAGTYEYSVDAYIDGTVDADQVFEVVNLKLRIKEEK